jgi:hypothetical protein
MLPRPAVLKTDYPMRTVILSERSEPKDLSSPAARVLTPAACLSSTLPFVSFQSLTNCPRFPTLSEPLSFQPITNCPICKPFVLITIQQYRGWVGGSRGPNRNLQLRTYDCRVSPKPERRSVRRDGGADSAWRCSGKCHRRSSQCKSRALRCRRCRPGPLHSCALPAETL